MEDNNLTPQTQTAKMVAGPKALFWYLTLFFTLAITATSTGAMWFQYINKLFPKEVAGVVRYSFSQGAVKYAIASLLVAAPLFFIFTWLIRKALVKKSLDTENKVRTWITYVILFITIAISIGDLITAVLGILNGDFTLRFLLKVATILVISGWVFVYYWLELKSDDALAKSTLPKAFGIVSAVVVLVSFVGGFFIVDSPAVTRAKAYDRTVVENLNQLKYAVDSYYQEFGSLPEDLATLKEYRAALTTTDIKTGKEYEYSVIDETSYELCAEFQTSNKEITAEEDYYYYGPDSFVYEAGRNCFTRQALDINNSVKPIPIR